MQRRLRRELRTFRKMLKALSDFRRKHAFIGMQWRKPNSRFTPYFLIGRKRGSCSFRKRKKAPVRKRIVNF